ncbi:hypothetical protein GCM10007856_04930 [Azospirillum oryzae]|nr:hypothetical protein GCM10007856_04930 [Azospirillum oryzae]
MIAEMETGRVAPEQCRHLRNRPGWSQEMLAGKAALSVSVVRRSETGRESSRGTVPVSLRRAFEIAGVDVAHV